MHITIGIPTLKSKKEVQNQIDDIMKCKSDHTFTVIASCKKQSAAKNRNWIIDNAKTYIVVMMDDDITGFYDYWLDSLVNPLIRDPDISIVSARPKKLDGSWCPILGDNNKSPDPSLPMEKCIHTTKTGLNLVGSACIAFNTADGIRFDENYIKAVYEDTDFCMQYKEKYSYRDIVFANNCNIIHLNAMQGRTGKDIAENRQYFAKKWSIKI